MVGALSILRWLDWIFRVPSLSIRYVAINKDLEKLPPQPILDKVKMCYDQFVTATK